MVIMVMIVMLMTKIYPRLSLQLLYIASSENSRPPPRSSARPTIWTYHYCYDVYPRNLSRGFGVLSMCVSYVWDWLYLHLCKHTLSYSRYVGKMSHIVLWTLEYTIWKAGTFAPALINGIENQWKSLWSVSSFSFQSLAAACNEMQHCNKLIISRGGAGGEGVVGEQIWMVRGGCTRC